MSGFLRAYRGLPLALACVTALALACNFLSPTVADPSNPAAPTQEVGPTAVTTAAEQGETPTSAPPETPASVDQDPVMGTIQATIDGEARTWYVLRTGRPELVETTSGWFYIPDDPDIPFVSITGFEDRDVPFETFEFDESVGFTRFGDYKKSVLAIGFQFDPDQQSVSYQYPYEGPDLAGSVSYMPDASDMSNSGTFLLTDGFLEVEYEFGTGQDLAMMQGTFAGTLFRLDHNELLNLSDGQFHVEAVNFVEFEAEE